MNEEAQKKFNDALTDMGVSFILSAAIWSFFLYDGEKGLVEFTINIIIHIAILYFIYRSFKEKDTELAGNISLILLIAFIIIVLIVLSQSYEMLDGQHFAKATPAVIGIWESYKAMSLFKSLSK